MKYYVEIDFGKKLKHCMNCPMCASDDICNKQEGKDFDTWAEQMINCPLKEFNEQQPTPE